MSERMVAVSKILGIVLLVSGCAPREVSNVSNSTSAMCDRILAAARTSTDTVLALSAKPTPYQLCAEYR